MEGEEKRRSWREGWPGVGLVAITYIYFLIFAQFGLLKRLAELGIGGPQLKLIMGAMATGGMAASLLVSRVEGSWLPASRLQTGLFGCALGAVLTLLPLNLAAGMAVSLLIGVALGLLTVTLVARLRLWLGTNDPLFKIGLGVGLGYWVCNFPPLFEAPANRMAVVAAVLCVGGMGLAGRHGFQSEEAEPTPARAGAGPIWLVVVCFTALVWLDSAAFYIIQNTPALKTGTWEGSRRLWQNGGLHFFAGLAGAVLLQRRGLSFTLALAFGCLAVACWLLIEPGRSNISAWLYPVGVSLYSVALVAFPAYLAPRAPAAERARVAGQLYAAAGWLGSALGIGMAESLRRIPPAFVLGAATLFVAPYCWTRLRARRREILTLGTLLAGAGVLCLVLRPSGGGPPRGELSSLVTRGRRVYIAEGCIHCHSQYVRPNSRDEIMWGPATSVTIRRSETPPLIGNRRRGPDLTEMGGRRSAAWLREHFRQPNVLSYHSPMPAYEYLFADERGASLIAYLQSLGVAGQRAHYAAALDWRLSEASRAAAKELDGAALLQKHCATCHEAQGRARTTWPRGWLRPPPNLVAGPFVYAPSGMDSRWRQARVAEIIKFGLPGTEMPGHEYLADAEVAAMASKIVNGTETKDHESATGRR